MLNVFTLTNGRLFQEEIDSLQALADLHPVWVDLESPSAEEKDWVRERFGVSIPVDIVDDDIEESARFYEEDNGELHIRSDFLIDDDQQARSLAGGRSRVIGLLVQGLETAYTGEIIRGIDVELEAAQYDLMLYTTHRRAKESAYVTTITRGMADGLLLILPRNPEAYLESLQRKRFPYVLIDHQGVGEGGAAVGFAHGIGA